jgi:hypothetical protein
VEFSPYYCPRAAYKPLKVWGTFQGLRVPAKIRRQREPRGAAVDFSALEAAQNAANAKAGPRAVPGRSIPVPATASERLQVSIAAPTSQDKKP